MSGSKPKAFISSYKLAKVIILISRFQGFIIIFYIEYFFIRLLNMSLVVFLFIFNPTFRLSLFGSSASICSSLLYLLKGHCLQTYGFLGISPQFFVLLLSIPRSAF